MTESDNENKNGRIFFLKKRKMSAREIKTAFSFSNMGLFDVMTVGARI